VSGGELSQELVLSLASGQVAQAQPMAGAA
jgi:hypothetical protein